MHLGGDRVVFFKVPRMEDGRTPKRQIVTEFTGRRQRINEVKGIGTAPGTSTSELSDVQQRYHYLLAASPAIIYATQASGDFACTFVSENIRTIMGFAPEEMITDPKCWPDRLHQDDAARVLRELPPLIEQGGGTVEYRFHHRDGHYVWIQDTFKVVYDEANRPMELVGAWADISKRKQAEQNALRANAEVQQTKQRYQYLLAASPAIIYATQVSGDFACTFVSENIRTIIGFAPEEMITDPKCWPDRLHQGDAPRVLNELSSL